MRSLSKTAGALSLSLAALFGTAAGANPAVPDNPLDDPVWHDRLAPLIKNKTIRNAREQCVPVANIGRVRGSPVKNDAQAIVDVMKRTKLTAGLIDTFARTGGTFCFMDFDKEYGRTSLSGAGGVYYHEGNAVALNTSKELGLGRGCQVMLTIHETEHLRQEHSGFGFPKDPVESALTEYIGAIESDAHTIETIGSWMLAQPQYSSAVYNDALDCLSVKREGVAYKSQAADLLKNIVRTHPDWIDNGQAARQIYGFIRNNDDFQWNYLGMGIKWTFDCDNNDSCLQQKNTLKDLGMDVHKIGAMHYPENYLDRPLLPNP